MTTPTPQPVKINARDLVIEASESTTGTTWARIHGLTSAVPNTGDNEEVVNTTTFDSAGTYEQEVMQRGASLALEGFLIRDAATNEQDSGQAAVERLAGKTGYDSLGRVRFRYPADKQWKVWTATFSVGESGGGNNDKTAWKATVTRSGPSRTEPINPSAGSAAE